MSELPGLEMPDHIGVDWMGSDHVGVDWMGSDHIRVDWMGRCLSNSVSIDQVGSHCDQMGGD